VAFLLGAGLTLALTSATWTAHDRNENRLLRQRTREAAMVLSQGIPTVEQRLMAAAQLADATDGDPEALRGALEPFVGEGRPFASAAFWSPGDGQRPIVTLGAAPKLTTRPATEVQATLTRARKGDFVVLDLLDAPTPRLGYARTAAGTAGRYIAYAEGALPANRTAVVRSDNAFAGLGFALYLGRQERDDRLLIASTADLPLHGRRSVESIPFGTSRLRFVVTPTSQLGGALMARLPAIVAGSGLLATTAAALLIDRLVRRREQAERLAVQLSEVAEEYARL
jgi:hypothetical protein